MPYDVIITLITTDTVSDCGRRSPLMFIDQHFEKTINFLSPEIPACILKVKKRNVVGAGMMKKKIANQRNVSAFLTVRFNDSR